MIGIFDVDELEFGGIVGLMFFPWLDWWVLPVMVMTALFWALGGAGWLGTKAWRRIGVPVLLSTTLLGLSLKAILAGGIGFGILCIGYGIPSTQPPDEGSWLGRWCLKLNKNEIIASWLAKGIIVSLLFLDYFVFLQVVK